MRGIAKGRVLVFVFVVLVSLLAGMSQIPTARAAVLYVGGVGPGNYTSIQTAVDAASPEDTVYVYSGIYEESVYISKPLSLVGEDAETTEIMAEGFVSAIRIYASHVNVLGFTMGGSSSSVLGVEYADYCTIADNIFHGDTWTISLWYSDHNTIRGNTVREGLGAGIRLGESHTNTIEVNSISAKEWGVVLVNSYSNIILGNTVLETIGAGIHLYESKWNHIVWNTIGHNRDGVEIVYAEGMNKAYHNNFIQNIGDHGHACDDNLDGKWDDGYPSGGNYWDDYTGKDEFSGPNQDIPGPDGIGDTPRVVPPCQPECGDPVDRYPLMTLYAPLSPLVGLYGTLQSDEVTEPLRHRYGLSGVENITANHTPPGGGGGSRLSGSPGHEHSLPEPGVGVPLSTGFESRVSRTGSIGTSTLAPDWGSTRARSNP
jgi:parallel beta-helix repeat protein